MIKPIDVFAIEESAAKVQALAKTVADLLDLLKRNGGFMWPQDQALCRRARAELVEMGCTVNREDT